MIMKVTLAIKNSDHPLYKIFGGIPVRSADLTHVSVTHYEISEKLQKSLVCQDGHGVAGKMNCRPKGEVGHSQDIRKACTISSRVGDKKS
jgi:hypothetical protein